MPGSVLIIDDDQDVSTLVTEVLREEGFTVSELSDMDPATIRAEVGRLEPDVVLLDGAGASGYGHSWLDATWLHERARPIAVIMFTVQAAELTEAQRGDTQRSQSAAFVGFLVKPFDLQRLIDVVTQAVEEPAVVLELRGHSSSCPGEAGASGS